MMKKQWRWIWVVCLVMALAAVGPATVRADDADDDALLEEDAFLEEEGLLSNDLAAQQVVVFDPLEPFNRVVFAFNDDMYVGVMRPMALGYRYIVPPEMRLCASNFFRNLAAPARALNCFFQGKWRTGGRELLKFTINTLAGLGGLADIGATYPELDTSPEDLGQTLAKYGVGDGPYLVLPLVGPSNLRDAVGLVGDGLLKPTGYVLATESSMAVEGFSRFNSLSINLEDIDTLRGAAIEPYESARDFYFQLRQQLHEK